MENRIDNYLTKLFIVKLGVPSLSAEFGEDEIICCMAVQCNEGEHCCYVKRLLSSSSDK